MIRIFEIKLPLDHSDDAIPRAVSRALQVSLNDIERWEIRRQAIDARKKNSILLIYTVDVTVRDEKKARLNGAGYRIVPSPDESYNPVHPGQEALRNRPVVVGSGPAGLFAGLILAQAGYRPVILERGKPVEERCQDVERFWKDGVLDPESNAQFGEGGAGTFSDGKLNTLINDARCRKVLEEMVGAGGPPSILISSKPHIGTDRLRQVVRTIRESIIALGGEVRFKSRLSGIRVDNGRISAVEISNGDILECQAVILAIGHSARDTVAMLLRQGLAMTPKAFSIGLRIEHPQKLINQAQYGPSENHPRLGPADYKLAYHAPNGRSAYTFCMCPGGEVIAASSEPGGIVTNGMSLFARNGSNANSALLVGVTPEDFPGNDPLAGFAFQKQWESAAFRLTGENYHAPVQIVGDFLVNKPSTKLGSVIPTYRPGVVVSNLHQCLPGYVCDTLIQAIPAFTRQLQGFNLADAVLTGVETRSSSPVRLTRDANYQSNISGLYPVGEGAGYAGGIMSAAADGIRCAEAIISRFAIPA